MTPPDDLDRAVEAALFAAEAPLTLAELLAAVGGGAIEPALIRLQLAYAGRGIELVERGGRWLFQTAPDLAHILRRTREEPRKLSRAGIETLAIIAYHEPVSRGEIEAIRGVQIAKGTLDVLMEAGWVRPAGRREAPGRPLLYATTAHFLAHFGLQSRRDLPGIDDLKLAGLLDPVETMLLNSEVENEDADAKIGGSLGRRSMGSMSIWHWLIVGVVVMLLFGKGRISDVMGDAAKGIKAFKKGMAEDEVPPYREVTPSPRLQGQPPIEPNAERDLHPMRDDRPSA